MSTKYVPKISSVITNLLPTSPGHPQFLNANLGRGCGHGFGNNKPQCQLCGKFGHLVHRCFRRFNVHFTSVTVPAYSSPNTPIAHLFTSQWSDTFKYDTFVYPA